MIPYDLWSHSSGVVWVRHLLIAHGPLGVFQAAAFEVDVLSDAHNVY